MKSKFDIQDDVDIFMTNIALLGRRVAIQDMLNSILDCADFSNEERYHMNLELNVINQCFDEVNRRLRALKIEVQTAKGEPAPVK